MKRRYIKVGIGYPVEEDMPFENRSDPDGEFSEEEMGALND